MQHLIELLNGQDSFGVLTPIKTPAGDIYPTKKTGVYMKEKSEGFSSVITLLNLPTFPAGKNRMVQNVRMPKNVGLYFLENGAKKMMASYPMLDPHDFVLYPDLDSDEGDVMFRVSKNILLLDMEESGVIGFEPAWMPSMRPAQTSRRIKMRMGSEIQEIEVANTANVFGDLRVFPGGSSDPLFVVPCPYEGRIQFTNSSHTYTYESCEELYEGLITSSKFIGAYDEISEEILTARMVMLHTEMNPWATLRNEQFDPAPMIKIATSKLTKRETRTKSVMTDGSTTVVKETIVSETTLETDEICM